MSRRKFYLSAILLLSISLAYLGNAFYAAAAENEITICKGVYIDDVDVSGMTAKEAKKAVEDFVKELRNKSIAIIVGNNTVYTTLGELGYTYEPNDNIKQALSLGTAGNLIKRYKDLKDIEQGRIFYPLTFKIDDRLISDLVAEKGSLYNIEPVNATVTRRNGEFVYTDHILGSKVDVAATTNVIIDTVLYNWNRLDIVVQAIMEDDFPIFTRDVVENCNTILGTFTTEYTDSAEGRAANLANGARLINNTVLFPGEVFSGYEYLAPFEPENGYFEAGAYSAGKIIDSIGGGACQVTTTLYNAVLYSELEVVERSSHSMTISYVDLSRDAAISGTYKDLKFKNNTDVPILIEAFTEDRKITFRIWGHETRDTNNRRVEYVTHVLDETAPPPDVIEEDPTRPITYRKVTQSAHVGYKAELYKVVYENDVEISRTLVNKSAYAAEPRYVTIGTKEEKPKNKPEESDNDQAEQDGDRLESQAEVRENRTNPEGQLQQDIYWDPSLEEEVFEDE